MKRVIALLLVVALLTGCSFPVDNKSEITESTVMTTEQVEEICRVDSPSLNEPELLEYIEETVYTDLVSRLGSSDYLVENIEAVYISNEYIEELTYNSQSNIYFGYTLAELDSFFQDSRYIFTLGEDGTTTVKQFEKYDNSYERMVKQVAIGTGVILVCVVVTVVSKAAGAAAVSMVFAASAKTGAACALSSGVFSGVTSGVVTGLETKDMEAAIKAAAASGSEGFMWGAIGGTISGGVEKTASLYGAARNGLTMSQAAKIQQESKLPLDFIKSFHSVDEYNLYKNSGLQLAKVNNKLAFTQKIDWDFVGDLEDGRTNAQRVLDGLAPLDSLGKPYELHHIGQKGDSPLAVLTQAQHRTDGTNYKILHKNTGLISSEVDHGTQWKVQKEEFWKSLYELTKGSE